VGLGTLSILPAPWLTALATSMTASRHFRFVWSVAAAQQLTLPTMAQLVAARAACAAEGKGSEGRTEACARVESLAKSHPRLAAKFPSIHDILAGTTGPGNVYIVPWAPQVAVLSHASVKLFITHGGMNGVAEGTFTQRPMLCMPLFSDQPDNCARIQDRGYGLTLHFNDLHSRWMYTRRPGGKERGLLDPMLLQLYTRPSYGSELGQAWAQNKAAGGVQRAVDIIELAASQPYGAHLEGIPSSYFSPWYLSVGTWVRSGSQRHTDVLLTITAVCLLLAILLRKACQCCCCRCQAPAPQAHIVDAGGSKKDD
jgi:hypothetical protein